MKRAKQSLLAAPARGEHLGKPLKGTDSGQANVLVQCSYKGGLGAGHRVQIQFKLGKKKNQDIF